MPWTVKLTMAPNHLTFVCQTMCQAFYMHYILLNLDPCNAFITRSHAPNPVPPPKPVPLTTEQVSGNPSEQQGLSPGKAGLACLCTRGRPSSHSGDLLIFLLLPAHGGARTSSLHPLKSNLSFPHLCFRYDHTKDYYTFCN